MIDAEITYPGDVVVHDHNDDAIDCVCGPDVYENDLGGLVVIHHPLIPPCMTPPPTRRSRAWRYLRQSLGFPC